MMLMAASVQAQQIRITADVNRDGSLDSFRDDANEDQWTWERGAVFLNNNDSDQDSGEPDHADTVVNGASDLEDLAPIRIDALSGFPDGTEITVSVDGEAEPYVRIFLDQTDTYAPLNLNASGNISDVTDANSDTTLLIEANAFAHRNWDGLVDVTVTATPPGGTAVSDTVRMRVAPWLMLSNIQPASEVYFREYLGRNDVMKSQLQAILPGIGATLVISPDNAPYPNNNIWMQDAFEVGYTEMPGQRMNVVLKSNRGSSWPLSNFPKDSLLAADYGWFSIGSYRSTTGGGSAPDGWLDWFGNLEVTPPLPGYPYGRIYYGYNPDTGRSLDPEIVDMLNAQELQGPALALDTGWLLIQHVDEMVAWVPTAEGGQKILVPDTRVMYDLLDQWVTDGYSSQPMLRVYSSSETVGAFAGDSGFRNANLNLQQNRIEPMIDTLKTEWGLTEDDLIRVPSAYYSNGGAYVPSMVNALVLNGAILVSDPHGPEPDGTDLMQAYFEQSLIDAGVDLNVHYLDDWRYHTWSGNVHCATNARREGFTPDIWEALTQNSMNAEGWTLY